MDLIHTIQTSLTEEETRVLRAHLGTLGDEARAFRFRVAPNPCVGAAVLAGGALLGRGFHELWGESHAEIQALERALESGIPRSRWDTLLCTLEPCSSQGKTPPCVEAILAAGIRRVVVGALDPDPRHRGRGLELLHAAGVEVVHLEGASPLDRVAPHFLRWASPERLRRPWPWTIAKWAQTRTGQLTPPADVGDGRWISSPASLADVQHLRGRVDAIVTGVGTVIADDPRLTVRLPEARSGEPPLRVVLDTTLRMRPDVRLFEDVPGEEAGEVHVFSLPGAEGARVRALRNAGAHLHAVRPGDDGHPSLREVTGWLYENGARRILLEAGPRVAESWFKAELVDQVVVYTGDVNGGRGPTLAEHIRPENLVGVRHDEVGSDSVLEAFLGSR